MLNSVYILFMMVLSTISMVVGHETHAIWILLLAVLFVISGGDNKWK